MTEPDYSKIPSHMREGTRAYVERGRHPGGFLRSVLENKLVEAVNQADGTNVEALEDWVNFVYWEIPGSAWGSEEAVDAWIEQGGLEGIDG